MLAGLVLAQLLSGALAYQSFNFTPPSTSPTTASTNYTGQANGTLSNSPTVSGKAFDRFVSVWLENTDFATANSSAVFRNLSSRGILSTGYHGVTHPSEPNYIASVAGDFFGIGDDKFYHMPSNVSTVVDLLESKNISWASYQENMPYRGFGGFNYSQPNYLTGSGDYVFYVRKHNPTIICDSVASVPERALRHRNFNDFAADVNANTLPQWMFITPNLVNDAHDTNVDFTSQWLEYFLMPLLDNPNFNTNRTLIVLTFDENETYEIANNVYTLFLGGSVPQSLVGTTDDTYYTHYSSLSTVENNWDLPSLGRGDTNSTMNNVYKFVASVTGYQNNGLTNSSTSLPMTNLTGIFPGPGNIEMWTPALAPNVSGVGAGANSVMYNKSVTNTNLTSATPMNLTALNMVNPAQVDPGYNYASGSLVVTGTTPAGPALIASAAPSSTSSVSGSPAASAVSGSGSSGSKNAAVGKNVVAAGAIFASAIAGALVIV